MTNLENFKSTSHAALGTVSARMSKMHSRPAKDENSLNDFHDIQMVDPENVKICHPEKKLLIAVIVRAFQDLASGSFRDQAKEWLTSTDGPFVWGSLAWYCEQLGFDVDRFKIRTAQIVDSNSNLYSPHGRKGNEFQDIL